MQPAVEKQCPYCDRYFEVKLKHPKSFQRIHCSRSCAAKSRVKLRPGFEPWSKEEVDYLQSLIGKKQETQITRSWNAIAKKRGWPTRSAESIRVKLGRICTSLKQSRIAKYDNWTMYELSRQLDVPNDRVRQWHRQGLKRERCSRATTAIRKVDLAMFAALHPEEFWGIDPKYLGKVLGDTKLAKYIERTVEQPTVGRPMTVVRLDTGDIYRSAKQAACQLNIGKHVVLDVCGRDTPARNGMDFARLDYPIYWVPWAVREEFNELAGKLLYELYLELKDLGGYKKTSVLIVAGRMAVQIALTAFRRRHREARAGADLTPEEELAEYWKQYFLKNLKLFLTLDQQQSWRQVLSRSKGVAYKIFQTYLPTSTQRELSLYLEEYGLYYIEKATQYFFRNSYLPKNYNPSSPLEVADFFAFMYSATVANVYVGLRIIKLAILLAIRYIEQQILPQGRTADLSGTGLDEDENDRGFQLTANSAITRSIDQQCDTQHPLDALLSYIALVPNVSREQCDRYQLYIDLKLEDCSDTEIANVLSISKSEVVQIEFELREFATEFKNK